MFLKECIFYWAIAVILYISAKPDDIIVGAFFGIALVFTCIEYLIFYSKKDNQCLICKKQYG